MNQNKSTLISSRVIWGISQSRCACRWYSGNGESTGVLRMFFMVKSNYDLKKQIIIVISIDNPKDTG